MSQYGKLAKNTLWFAMGEFGSKLIIFFMVPLYTSVLTRKDFGEVDIFNTTLSLLIPIISLILPEAVLRFLLDRDEDKSEILTNALITMLVMYILFVLISDKLLNIKYTPNAKLIFNLVLLFTIIVQLFASFTKGIGKIMIYSLGGILQTILTVCLNIFFLLILKIGINGIFYSTLVSQMVSALYYIYFSRGHEYIRISKINLNKTKDMLKFSIPLIPNVLNWWIMNVSDRYILLYFLGYEATGLYAVSCKIPTIISVLNSIFYQSWQLAAIDNYNSKDRDAFYTNVFKINMALMFIVTSGILMILKIFMKFYVSNNFYVAYKYVPFLLVGAIFSSFSSFFGVGYLATKNTSKAFTTSIMGSLVNVIINVLFIPYIGIQAAAISTLLAYLTMWVVRVYQTRTYYTINIDFKKLIFSMCIVLYQSYLIIYYEGVMLALQIILFLFTISIFYKEIMVITTKVKKYILYKLYKLSDRKRS
jgi:O-antigen/teichoic acid export membrane protein